MKRIAHLKSLILKVAVVLSILTFIFVYVPYHVEKAAIEKFSGLKFSTSYKLNTPRNVIKGTKPSIQSLNNVFWVNDFGDFEKIKSLEPSRMITEISKISIAFSYLKTGLNQTEYGYRHIFFPVEFGSYSPAFSFSISADPIVDLDQGRLVLHQEFDKTGYYIMSAILSVFFVIIIVVYQHLLVKRSPKTQVHAT